MRRFDESLTVLSEKELSMVSGGSTPGGLGQASTAQAMMEAYKSLDYRYIGKEFVKPVAKDTAAAVAGGFAATRNPVGTLEAGVGGLVYSATSRALDQDFSKWVKPEPPPQPKLSWADFRRMDNR
jgi:hypothetical protein